MRPLLDPAPQLAHLKDFQLATVDYVFRRMYEQPDPRLRFLVADEVGLGKTLVARGVVAKAIRHLQEAGVDRIDVIYVCSNAAIAAQNIARLNVLPDAGDLDRRSAQFATRLTLLPLRLHGLTQNSINFISFTPGTTFDLKSTGGVAEERALIWYALRDLEGPWKTGLSRLLRGAVGVGNWEGWHTKRWDHAEGDDRPNDELLASFVRRVSNDGALWQDLCEVAEAFRGVTGDPSTPLSRRRYQLVGQLRRQLATACLDALEPDLIILDEFQRFKHLIDHDRAEKGDESTQLAMALMNWRPPNGPAPRALLLSATPYKMFTVHGEVDDNHYKDFLGTMRFLLDDGSAVEALANELRAYRHGLQRLAEGAPGAARDLTTARDALQERLLSVMVRTERVGDTAALDAMVEEHLVDGRVEPDDVGHALALDRLRRAAGSQDIIDYWKSAPYLLSFMKGYDLIRRLDQHTEGKEGSRPASDVLAQAVEAARSTLLPTADVEQHRPLDPRNGRLRNLLDEVEEQGTWALLWVPPSLPYLEPSGRYEGRDTVTKSLVFSAWNVVPDAVAAVTSYEAERRMMADRAGAIGYTDLTRRMRGLLRFAVTGEGTEQERFAGMGALLLGYPSPTLAAVGDPLALALEAGAPMSPGEAKRRVARRLRGLIDVLPLVEDGTSFEVDPRWYWVALASLDAHHDAAQGQLEAWLRDPAGWRELLRPRQAGEDDHTGFDRVLDRFVEALGEPPPLRRRPADLEEVLATLALGGPAVCALRALHRHAPGLATTDPTLLTAAAAVGEGFRTLFNVPESMALLRADDDYWRAAAAYGVEGNLQAVLDEHLHTLRESLGLFGRADDEVIRALGRELGEAMSLRTSTLRASGLDVDPTSGWLLRDQGGINLRTRFGLRFGDPRDEQGSVQRADLVRKAFNTPFRPFLLASTSVGQEGLDFHTWCHRVVHWNLPTNPVDMEQREGRVHRYKGLAVRRNVARRFGLAALASNGHAVDPWATLFQLARNARHEGRSDLVPYWIYDELEEPTRVQRYVPMLPLSREHGRYAELKKRLVLYRLAFGQPRQEDLVTWLSSKASDEARLEELTTWQLNLSPLRRGE